MGKSEHLFETIFQRNLSDGDARDFLTGLVKEHPYFTAAQFYLLQQTDTNATDYTKQAARTSVLFNNPFWLQFQLSQSNAQPFVHGQNIITEKEVDTTVYKHVTGQPENTTVIAETSDSVLGLEETGIPEENENTTSTYNETAMGAITPLAVEETYDNTSSLDEDDTTISEIINTAPQTEMPASPAILENETIAAPSNEPVESLTTVALQQTTENFAPVENIQPGWQSNDITLPVAEEINAGEITPEHDAAIESSVTAIEEKPEDITLPQTGEYIEENYTEQQYLEDREQPEDELAVEEKEIEPMNIKLNFTTATATTEDTISFEPLHTSDYFASVGIKFSDEVKPGDKLGKQLKSFTEWLKTMKKIHTDQLPVQSEQSVISIQKMAEKSNTDDEVLTEAMAEVLLQQGKGNKAVEVYKKLSLLNPSKSAYFAAKIDHIEK